MIQDDIAGRIVESLRVQLLQDDAPPASRRTEIEGYHEYLKARFHTNRRTGDGLTRGIAHARNAVAIDHDYAPAHACLADGLFLLSFQGGRAPEETIPEAKAAAMRALELDEKLADAHVSFATILATYDWDWPAAEASFRRAIELGTRDPAAHYWFAMWYLVPHRRFSEAEQEIVKARQLDPLSLVVNAGMGWQFLFAGQFERALEEAREAMSIDADFPMSHDIAAQALGQLRRYDEAVHSARTAVALTQARSLSLAILGHTLGIQGNKVQAAQVLRRLVTQRKNARASCYDLALVCAGMGETEEALDWLELAVDERHGWSVFIGVDPRFEALRTDARFAQLTTKLGLG